MYDRKKHELSIACEECLTNETEDIVRAFSSLILLNRSSLNIISIQLFIIDNNEIQNISFCDTAEKNKPNTLSVNISYTGVGKDVFPNQKSFIYNKELYSFLDIKSFVKISLYEYLSFSLNETLPYGSLTGIRPTKLFYRMMDLNLNTELLKDVYLVSEKKYNLIKEICKNQESIYNKEKNKIDLFINIPICISKCSFCSFPSIIRDKLHKKIPIEYASRIKNELDLFFSIFKKEDIRSIYIGGGTPTALNIEELNIIFEGLSIDTGIEFTLECGRADTLTSENLSLFSEKNVNRISVNPQTFLDKTLTRIGRKHTVDEFYKAYKLSKNYNFSVNMDLIAALPNESLNDFQYSVDCAVDLYPNNITVHALALKRGSNLLLDNYDNTANKQTELMIDYAYNKLSENKYTPYYMYRLKNMNGCLENVGYSLKDNACVYNIDIMEETHSIYAIGGGGISKRIFKNDRIERLATSKDLHYYLENFDKILYEKSLFWQTEKT